MPPTRRDTARATRRQLAARRRRRQRLAIVGALVVVLVTVVAVPRLIASAPAAGASSTPSATPTATADTTTELIGQVDTVLATDADLVSDDARAALTAARDSTDEGGSSDELTSALADFVASVTDAGTAVLGEDSDAESSTEDALYAAVQSLDATDPAALPAALAAADEAADAVRASAQEYRDSIAAASADTNTQPTGGDVDAQLSYLMTYTYDYNDVEWGDYNDYGGDCTNFASQGLIARGWSTDDVWYSDGDMWTASKPWIATAQMAAYFDSLGLSYSTQDDLDRVRVGDIGLFDWGEDGSGYDHTMTVSKVEYTPDGPVISFVSHNNDDQYRDMETVMYGEHSDSSVRIYSIP